MSLLFTHEKHTATLRSGNQAAACTVYGDWPILGAKIDNNNETCKKSAEKFEFIGEFVDSSIYTPTIRQMTLLLLSNKRTVQVRDAKKVCYASDYSSF